MKTLCIYFQYFPLSLLAMHIEEKKDKVLENNKECMYKTRIYVNRGEHSVYVIGIWTAFSSNIVYW